ncbi:hypothetical protein ACP70R_021631 [Stipagrostis hirtigluma subsp. patula]
MAPPGHNLLQPPFPSLPPSSSSLRRRRGDAGLAVRRRHGHVLPGVPVSAASDNTGQELSFLDGNGRPDDAASGSAAGDATRAAAPSGYARTICRPSSNLDFPLIQQHSVDARPPVLSVVEAVRRHTFSRRQPGLCLFFFPFFVFFRLQLQPQLRLKVHSSSRFSRSESGSK